MDLDIISLKGYKESGAGSASEYSRIVEKEEAPRIRARNWQLKRDRLEIARIEKQIGLGAYFFYRARNFVEERKLKWQK